MTDLPKLAASLLHLRGHRLSRGEPVAPPLVLSTMYHLPGDPAGSPGYGRVDNATWEALEAALGHLEQAEALVFPSGMGAISAAFLALVGAGDRVVIPSDGYYATRLLARRFLAPLGVTVEERPTRDYLAGGFLGVRLAFVESPSNPGLDLCDIAAVADAVHGSGGLLVADNTTMTPYGQRPLDLGADLVVAADTKAPSGQSDVLLGHVASRDPAIMAALRDWCRLSGAIPGPFECWLLLKGLETLELRYARMCATAQRIAERLAGHPKVRAIRYPGLAGDPARGLAARQMRTNGFLIALTLEGAAQAERFIDGCALLQPATSFGGIHSSAERRARWGDAVDDGFVRLSVGIEPAEPLLAALTEALDRA